MPVSICHWSKIPASLLCQFFAWNISLTPSSTTFSFPLIPAVVSNTLQTSSFSERNRNNNTLSFFKYLPNILPGCSLMAQLQHQLKMPTHEVRWRFLYWWNSDVLSVFGFVLGEIGGGDWMTCYWCLIMLLVVLCNSIGAQGAKGYVGREARVYWDLGYIIIGSH